MIQNVAMMEFALMVNVFRDNAVPSLVGNAIDGTLLTHTVMGNTVGQSERLRVTLKILSSSGPPSATIPEHAIMLLLGFGI